MTAAIFSLTILILSIAGTSFWLRSSEANALTAAECSNLTVVGVTASGYADSQRTPQNAIDNNFNTRWSNDGKGSWLGVDLGAKKAICYVDIAWYKGNVRINSFIISVSNDEAAYTNVYSGKSSGKTNSFERYNFADVEARYVKVAVNGNQWNDWASITEIDVYGGATGTSTPPSGSSLGINFANVANQDLSGTYKVIVSASDPSKVSNIKLYVDATLIKQENYDPYEFSTDTTKFADGSHTLKAVATDTSGNAVTKTITVAFDNTADSPPPTPTPTDLLATPTFKKKWAGTGSFDEPSSIDHDTAGNLWISPHDNKLEKHTFDGQVIEVITHSFSHPHGIAVDRERGNIVFAGDQENNRIQVFDNDGNFIKYISNSDMPHIHDIGYDRATGAIYAPDYEADHLQKINATTGEVIWKKTGLSQAWGVYTDSQGFIYLAVTGDQELHKLDPSNGNTIKKVSGFSGGQGITGVYVDKHDLVYVLDTPKDQVQIYDTELNKLATWNLATITGGITKPEDITISDDDKNIYIADSDGKLIYWLQRQ